MLSSFVWQHLRGFLRSCALWLSSSPGCRPPTVPSLQVKARKQPVQIFEQRMPCPNGVSQVESDGLKVPGSQTARSKHTVIGTCGGFTTGGCCVCDAQPRAGAAGRAVMHTWPAKRSHVLQHVMHGWPPPPLPLTSRPSSPRPAGAKLVKPPKDPPAPLPLILSAHAPKEKKDRGKKEAGHAAAPKRAAPAASPASAARRPAPGVPAPGAGAGARLLGAAHAPWTTVGARKPGGAAAPGTPPPGPPRLAELTLCKHLMEDGDCYVYRCPAAHSEVGPQQGTSQPVA